MTCGALEPLKAADNASIVNISSSTMLFWRQNYAHYVSSKAGVLGLTRAMARELGGFGIRANTVTPGPTFTEVERATVTPKQKRGDDCHAMPATPGRARRHRRCDRLSVVDQGALDHGTIAQCRWRHDYALRG